MLNIVVIRGGVFSSYGNVWSDDAGNVSVYECIALFQSGNQMNFDRCSCLHWKNSTAKSLIPCLSGSQWMQCYYIYL